MKILLVGEFSGFHRSLKLGLEKLGHDATLVGSSDGFKEIPIDINFWPSKNKNKIRQFLSKQHNIYNGIKKLPEFNIVQFISPLIFYNSIPIYGKMFNSYMYENIIKKSDKSFLVSCGNDPVFSQIGKNLIEYNPLDAEFELTGVKQRRVKDKSALQWNIHLSKLVNGVIPASYPYSVGYEKFKNEINLSEVMPMPIMTTEFNSNKNNIVNNKIRILHGITRPEMKGSSFILEALNEIKNNYSDSVDVNIIKKVNYHSYLTLVKETNILIDQCYSYGYGMNALIGLSFGKVVMSGAEQDALNALNVKKCPVINIIPNADFIFSELEKLVLNQGNLVQLGYHSRKYVEQAHDAVKVAEKYVDIWSKS